jgi:muconate cycloisomerase
MQITYVETVAARIPLVPQRRMITAWGKHDVSEFVLVRVGTDAGIEGAGEATVSPLWSGETVPGACAVIERLFAPALVGCDPRDIDQIDRRMERACRHNWFAKAAVEMACWDIAGKAAGRPVYELLGGAVRPLAVRSRFSLAAYPPAEAAARAGELVAAGFTTIKVKVGGPGGAADDVARVRAVREAIGPAVALTIDANCGWDGDTAVAAIRQMADCRLALAEQPTPDGDYAAMARVRRETGVPVMADESCFDLVHARELVRNACCDVISLYPGKNGGIARARRIAEFAEGRGVACSIGSNLEWDVGTAAMMHLIVATRNMRVEEFPGDVLGPSYHELSIAREPLSIRGPLTTLTERPGLGVEVDWDAVRRLRCG